MLRTERLFHLVHLLRQKNNPISGEKLAKKLKVSLRTIYRDIAALKAQGIKVIGEPGAGYLMQPTIMLPPLHFSDEEIEALLLGTHWVAERPDNALKEAARQAMSKISTFLPIDLYHQFDEKRLLLLEPQPISPSEEKTLELIRQAIQTGYKLHIHYIDLNDNPSQRTIWPFALGSFEQARAVVAWCEMRQQYRHFRTGRITHVTLLESRYPCRQQALLKKWREVEKITE